MYAIRSYYAALGLDEPAGPDSGVLDLIRALRKVIGEFAVPLFLGLGGMILYRSLWKHSILPAYIGIWGFAGAVMMLLSNLMITAGVSRITSYNVCYTKLLRCSWAQPYSLPRLGSACTRSDPSRLIRPACAGKRRPVQTVTLHNAN